jgi:hypothetical protein
MRPGGGAEDVMRGIDVGDPVPERLVGHDHEESAAAQSERTLQNVVVSNSTGPDSSGALAKLDPAYLSAEKFSAAAYTR